MNNNLYFRHYLLLIIFLKDAILCKSDHSWDPFHFNTSAVLAALSDSNIAVIAVYNPLMEDRYNWRNVQFFKLLFFGEF